MNVCAPPRTVEVYEALGVVGRVMHRDVAFELHGSFHFLTLDGSISVSPDSADRLRLDRWADREIRASLWVQADDRRRLVEAVRELVEDGVEVAA